MKYLSKYHINILRDENGLEYLLLEENEFNVSIYSEKGILLYFYFI